MENLVKDRDLLRDDKLGIEEKFQRSRKKCAEMEERFVSTVLENCNLEEKLGETQKRCQELEEQIVLLKDNIMILREENDFDEKFERSHKKCEMDERLAKMEMEIEEMRLDKLNADQTIEELKRKEFEADLIVQELKVKNVEAYQKIDKLREENMESESRKTLMVEKLAKILPFEPEYIRYLLHRTEDLAAAADGGDKKYLNLPSSCDGSKNDEVNVNTEETSHEAFGNSAGSKGSVQLGGKVSSSAAASVEVIICDSSDETSTPSEQTKKRSTTESWCSDSDDGSCSNRRRKRTIAANEKSSSSEWQRTKRSSPLTVEARQWKVEGDLNRPFIPERGITVLESCCPWLYESIAKKGWETFVAPPKGYDEHLVRDFYASLVHYDTNTHTVPIRGKLVELSADAINAYYQIPVQRGYPPVTFHDMDGTKLLDKKIRLIVHPDYTFKGGRLSSIRRHQLTHEARVWMYFNMCNLLPTTDTKMVSEGRALAIYCIVSHHYIDVGRVILSELWAARNSKQRNLVYPCLITGLCKAKGVPMIDEAHFTEPYGAIDNIKFFRLKS